MTVVSTRLVSPIARLLQAKNAAIGQNVMSAVAFARSHWRDGASPAEYLGLES